VGDRLAELESENAVLRRRHELLKLRLREERARRRELEKTVEKLLKRVEELERAAHRQAAPFRREESKKVPEGQKKRPGRPVGHPGASRPIPAEIDETVSSAALECCPDCGGPVDHVRTIEQFVEDIPPVRPRVTKIVTYAGTCARCGEVRTTHPRQVSLAEGAAKVQIGPQALGWLALLNKQCGLTIRKACHVLQGLAGLHLTPGGAMQALQRTAARVAVDYQALQQTLRQSPAVFADETSWWVGGPKWWLWTFTTPRATVYRVDQSRGSQVVMETLGGDYDGVLISDCLASYDPAPYRKHKCLAHHLRAINEARKRPDTVDGTYLDRWKTLLQEVLQTWGQRSSLPPEEFARRRCQLQAAVEQHLAEPANQPGDQTVRNRLAKHRAHLLVCLDDPSVEPTNNRAERALRPAVISRKISCGNKTLRGKACWEILTSLATTCHQQGINFIDYLAPRLLTSPPGG
jgi:transposase